MKRNLLFLALFLTYGFTSTAQVASMTPELVEQIKTVDLTDQNLIVKGYGELTNLSNSTTLYKWTINPVDVPTEWNFQLCDKNQCFGFGVLSNIDANIGLNSPVSLEANTISIMELGVQPNGKAGCGTFEVSVAATDNPDTILALGTYVFKLNVDENCVETTSTKNFAASQLKIFPNPTVDYFTLKENQYVKEVQIFNIVGKQMLFTPYQNGTAVNVSSFPNGLYLVRMLDKDGDVLKTTRLTKR